VGGDSDEDIDESKSTVEGPSGVGNPPPPGSRTVPGTSTGVPGTPTGNGNLAGGATSSSPGVNVISSSSASVLSEKTST